MSLDVLCCAEQFNRAQLSVFNNSWAEVSDSSPHSDEPNYQLMSEVSLDSLFSLSFVVKLNSVAVSRNNGGLQDLWIWFRGKVGQGAVVTILSLEGLRSPSIM